MSWLGTKVENAQRSFKRGAKKVQDHGRHQTRFWLIALLIGFTAGYATVLFRHAISWLQAFFYGADDVMLASAAKELPWFWVLSMPILGGLVVGFILQKFTPDGRARSVAHVIEGAALNGGRVEGRAGLASTVASLITLSTGGSTGREGPAVQLGAVISSKVANWMKADGITGRDLLGCATAAAVAASFNAPIAGAIFALEVILRHYAVHAFAPVAIAAVAGAVVSRLNFGNTTEFVLPPHSVEFYIELPAFVLLGVLCGFVAFALTKACFLAEDFGNHYEKKFAIPPMLRPAIAGLFLGVLAVFFPHIIGVGYETTSDALTGQITLLAAIVFAVIKCIAVAITIGGRMGGGVFSPSLMMGALTGLAFGWIATAAFPSIQGDETLYALAGMGAVAAAVLGAPISTSLVIIEMTGDWQAGIAVMVAVSLATIIASRMMRGSFFLEQLARRDVHLADGPPSYVLSTVPVRGLLKEASSIKPNQEKRAWKQIKEGIYIDASANLDRAMPMFEDGKIKRLPVVSLASKEGAPELIGVLNYLDAMKAYAQALSDVAREEHS